MVEILSLADIVPTDSIEEPLEQLILEQLITEVRGSSLAPHYVIWVCHRAMLRCQKLFKYFHLTSRYHSNLDKVNNIDRARPESV